MDKIGPGGVTPFPIQTKPNLFTPLRNEELLERRGESALWFRLSPCPCPQSERVPDCKFCLDGEIRTFQEDLEVVEEIAWKVDGNRLYTRYGPISSVDKLTFFHRGEERKLTPLRIESEYIEVAEQLEYYHQVQIDYKVKLVETIQVEFRGNNEFEVFPLQGQSKYLIGIEELYRLSNAESVPVKWMSHTLNSIFFKDRTTATYRGKIRVINPVKVAYKTFSLDKRKGLPSSLIELPDGEVMAVMGSGYRMGEGDIITLLKSTNRHSQFVEFKTGDVDRLPYSPIASIDTVLAKDGNGLRTYKLGEDFVIFGDNRLRWISDKPRSGYTIIYDYHPSFRVTGFMEGGSGEDRAKPRQFKMKAIPSFNGRT
jgi:hypothetical protein